MSVMFRKAFLCKYLRGESQVLVWTGSNTCVDRVKYLPPSLDLPLAIIFIVDALAYIADAGRDLCCERQ